MLYRKQKTGIPYFICKTLYEELVKKQHKREKNNRKEQIVKNQEKNEKKTK